MSIFITGATGFVGKNLMHYFSRNGINEVYELNLRFAWQQQIDADVSFIIHLAGKAHDLKKTSNPDKYYQVNYELTKKLYDAFLKSNASKFIFISSVKAAADQVEGILTEDIAPNPQTHYGKSKLMAERYIQSQPLPAGKSYYILRPCMIHGPGNKGNLNLLYKFVKKGIPYPLAGFNNERSYLSIDNFSFIIKELIVKDSIPSGIYNMADDEPLSTSNVVSTLADSLNIKPRLWEIPPAIIKSVVRIGNLLHLPLTTERLNKLIESYIVSNKKIKQALNIKLPLTAVNGLKKTAKSFNNN